MASNNISLDGKTVLVTGAAGFIGSNLVTRLLREVVRRLLRYGFGGEERLAAAFAATLPAGIVAMALLVAVASTGCRKTQDEQEAGSYNQYPELSTGHPRLFLNRSEVPALRRKVQTPGGQALVQKLKALSVPMTPEEEAQWDLNAYRYYFQMRGDISLVQLKALNYLLEGSADDADEAISTILAILEDTNFGTQNDLSRASGVRIMVGAMVYDWCYDRMTPELRSDFIDQFKRICGTMECGWPFKGVDYICGHASEWMILRDMLAAGIATYDEDSEIYDAVMTLLREKYIPARNYCYEGGAYHQGAGYVDARFTNDLTAMWMLSKLGMGNVFSDKIKDVAYEIIYRYRPDGQVLPNGDMNPNRRANIRSYAMLGNLAGSYFHDPYLQWMYNYDPSVDNHYTMLDLLWHDFNLTPRKPDDALPLVRYFGSPYGWNLVRTGWDENAVVAEMKVGEKYYGNHQHLDAGSFQIYYQEPLAIDSGAYSGTSGGYNSEHCMNYSKRTVAHNSLLVYNPNESFASSGYGGAGVATVTNDGGQRLPNKWKTCPSMEDLAKAEYTTGSVVSHWDDGRNVYLKGDISDAYDAAKVSSVQRSFFFLNSGGEAGASAGGASGAVAAMIIYDKVVSRARTYKKYWLLHSIEEPQIGDMSFDIARTYGGRTGRLHCTTLYPTNAVFAKVGGPGHEFEVFGTNYPNEVSGDNAGEVGAWRVEICPGEEALENKFLNVIEIGGAGASSGSQWYSSASKLSSTYFVGTRYLGNVILFSKDGALFESSDTISLSTDSTLYVCDLAPGAWRITSSATGQLYELVNVTAGQNILVSRLPAGSYSLSR